MEFLARHSSNLRYVTVLKKRQGTILVMGIMIFAFGTIFLCNIAALAAASWSVIGLMLCVTGVMQFSVALQMRERIGLLFWMPVVAFYVLFGAFALTDPPHRFASMNLVFLAGLTITGVLRTYSGLVMRRTRRGSWLIATGLVTTAIGGALISQWPNNSLSVAATMIAMDLMVYGLGFVGFSLGLDQPPAEPQSR